MNLDDLLKTNGEWLRNAGRMSDVVLSSRIRLARNLAEHPFLTTATSTQRTEIYRCLTDAVTAGPGGEDATLVDIDKAPPIERDLLVERHLISRQHVAAEGSRGVTISPGETRAVMINEEDHLRIQGLRSGLELEEIWDDLNEVDDALSRDLVFAFDKKLGYLTACPTNVGTGMRVSVMLHLPALKITKEIERVARAARDMHLAVRGMLGEGTDAIGDFYQVSNQSTLGKSETDIIQTFSNKIIPKIAEYERTARDSMIRNNPHELDDQVWRAFGILSNARRISSEETHALLSPIRMGIHAGRFNKIDITTLNDLFLRTQPAHLQKMHGEELDDQQRDVVRADYLRRRLQEGSGA